MRLVTHEDRVSANVVAVGSDAGKRLESCRCSPRRALSGLHERDCYGGLRIEVSSICDIAASLVLYSEAGAHSRFFWPRYADERG